MGALPNQTFVPVDEYLNSSYSPDLKYVDGVLVEREVGTPLHGLLQKLLLLHFARFEQSMAFLAIPECRTRITSARYRIPDVVLMSEPVNREARFCGDVPLAVIEILSPGDRMKSTLERFAEYQALGVPSTIQMDPEASITHVFESNNLIRKELRTLELQGRSLPFDTQELYRQLRA